MQVKEIMTRRVDVVSPDTTVQKAARIMQDDGVGSLLVGEDDRLVGVLTDRDIVLRVVAEGRAPDTTPVGDAMSKEVLYCYEDESPEAVGTNMGENQVRRLPVLNRDKRLVGVVSLGDLATGGPSGAAAEALEEIAQEA